MRTRRLRRRWRRSTASADEERHPARRTDPSHDERAGRAPRRRRVPVRRRAVPGRAARCRRAGAGGDRPIRVAVVPTAAGRGRPDLAAATGVAAFERVAAGRGIDVAAAAIGGAQSRDRVRPGAGGMARRGRRHPLPGRRPGPHPDA